MDFNAEIKSLDEVYTEVVEAIMHKPESQDVEQSRIYFENVSARMNHWASVLKDVKSKLEEREDTPDLTADNRPA